jgi:hypothetical protein
MQQSQPLSVNGGFIGFVPKVDPVRTTCGLRTWGPHASLLAPSVRRVVGSLGGWEQILSLEP